MRGTQKSLIMGIRWMLLPLNALMRDTAQKLYKNDKDSKHFKNIRIIKGTTKRCKENYNFFFLLLFEIFYRPSRRILFFVSFDPGRRSTQHRSR